MKFIFKSLVVMIFLCASVGCSSLAVNQKVSFSKVRDFDFKNINLSNVESEFGKPFVSEYTDKTQQEIAWIYLANDLRSTRLSLVFSTENKKLISAHWFFSEKDPESNFQTLLKNLPNQKFDLDRPVVQNGAFGPVQVFKSTNSNLEILVEKKTASVSAMTWKFAETSVANLRKPTSH